MRIEDLEKLWDFDDGGGRDDAKTEGFGNAKLEAFRVAKVNVPGMRRFGEYTEVTPAAVGSRLVWAFALELGPSSRALNAFSNPASVPVFKSIESDTLRHFAHLSPQA